MPEDRPVAKDVPAPEDVPVPHDHLNPYAPPETDACPDDRAGLRDRLLSKRSVWGSPLHWIVNLVLLIALIGFTAFLIWILGL